MNEQTGHVTSRWIINRQQDLTWLIGPAIASFALMALYYGMTAGIGLASALVIPVMYISWALLFDGTHVFATYTRTYFDRQFSEHSRPLLWYSTLFVLLGPLLVLGYYLTLGNDCARGIFILFNRFGLCWAYYHLVRQHWGFVALYRAKNNEGNLYSRKLDALLMASGTVCPFIAYHLWHFQPIHAAEMIPVDMTAWRTIMTSLLGLCIVGCIAGQLLYQGSGALKEGGKILRVFGLISGIMGAGIAGILRFGFHNTLLALTIGTFCIFIAAVIAQIIYLRRASSNGEPLNRPKWIFMITVLATHNILLLSPLPVIIEIMCLTIFHNIQYHRIVQFHNGNQYKGEEAGIKFGFAATLAQRAVVYVMLALAWSLFTTVPRAAASTMIQNPLLNFTLSAFFWGIAFNHYYLDSIIWRSRKNKQVAQSLKLSTVAS